MSDEIVRSGFHFEFNISRDEDRFFRTLVRDNLKAHVDRRNQTIIAFIVYATLFVASYIALDRGWLTPRTLFASILCLVVGQLYMFFMTAWSARRIFDRLYVLERIGGITWHVVFDESSIIVRTPNVESRMSWDTIAAVANSPLMVAIWYNARQGFFVPARVFADASTRAAFAEWVRERIERAAVPSNATKSA